MRYRPYRTTGIRTSLLGMGCMRLPCIDGDRSRIDGEKAEEILELAYQSGINYFDTAYVYGNGASERATGHALAKHPRESYYLTDKMPAWLLKTREDVARIFQEELERCGVDYFDFYLCHNVNNESIHIFTDPELGVIPYLEEMQRQGKIRYLGFSSHGSPETLKQFADLRAWDFAQIQLNYLDWEFQKAKEQYEILTERNIPVMVMEPVRGGRLASLCPEADALLKTAAPERSIASWALRFVADLPNVQVVLSGMSDLAQLRDNLDTFSREEPLTPEERATLEEALALFRQKRIIPCTSCGYCSGCPMELHIPDFLKAYNEYLISGSPMALESVRAVPGDQQPKACVGCNQCAEHCPQHIDVPKHMIELARALQQPKP